MIKTINLKAVPSQRFNAALNQQMCTISVYQKRTGLYLDLLVNDVPIVTGVLCRNLVKLVRDKYLGFIGDLAFVDTQGADDPQYQGLGARWVLMYLEASEA